MKKSLVLIAAMAVTHTMPANAALIELFEGSVNIDGGIQSISSNLSPEVDAGLFDFTTGIGSISYTITGAGAHHTSLYVDHQIDDPLNSFFNEFASETGVLGAGQSWEIDDPFFGDIFDNFLAGDNNGGSSLDENNGVPEGLENDVSMALAWNFDLGVSEIATVEFLLALQAPVSGFFLSHTDPESFSESIYFSSTLDIVGNPVAVPNPSTLILFATGLLGLIGLRFGHKHQ